MQVLLVSDFFSSISDITICCVLLVANIQSNCKYIAPNQNCLVGSCMQDIFAPIFKFLQNLAHAREVVSKNLVHSYKLC